MWCEYRHFEIGIFDRYNSLRREVAWFWIVRTIAEPFRYSAGRAGIFDPGQFDPGQFDPGQFDPGQFDPGQNVTRKNVVQ
jgi:hypothetical protein